MSAIANAVKPLLKLFSPAFYTSQFNAIVSTTRASFIAGSAAPLFKGIFLVGVTGYIMEYSMVGRYHVMDKQKIVKEAMAHHHH